MGKNANLKLNLKLLDEFLEEKEKRASKVEVSVSMIMLKENKSEWDEFINYFRARGIRTELGFFSKFNSSVGEINELYKKLSSVCKRQLLDDKKRYLRLSRYRCYFPWHEVSILWDGSIVPCCRDYNGDYILGNINKEPLKKIWNNKKAKSLRAEFINGKITNKLCKNCKEANWELKDILLNFPVYNKSKVIFQKSSSKTKRYNNYLVL